MATDRDLIQKLRAEVRSLRAEVGLLKAVLYDEDEGSEEAGSDPLDGLDTLDLEALTADGEDPLFASGYLAGKYAAGEPPFRAPPTYMEGYALGVAVRVGNRQPPYWDRTASN
jgi:hypothetical protein